MGIPDKEAWTDPEMTESTQPRWDITEDRRMAWIKWVPQAIAKFSPPNGEVKGRIQLDLQNTDDIGQALGLVVGAASVAWKDDDVDGRVFDTEMALDIVTQAEYEITRRIKDMLNAVVEVHNAGLSVPEFIMEADDLNPDATEMAEPVELKDTLAEWLFHRFGRNGAKGLDWSKISEEDVKYWHHEADAVRRAVARGGFKNPMPYDVDKARCWCGSTVGPRSPGDPWGNGCDANITHKWDGAVAEPADTQIRPADAGEAALWDLK
jgi:hypothetical protein